MSIVADIRSLGLAIASAHPIIGHNPSEPHFFGFNFDQLLNDERSKINYPCLGLTDHTHTGLFGNSFKSPTDTRLQHTFQFDIVLLDKCEAGDYFMEDHIYDKLYNVADDIISWMDEKANSTEKCNFPILELLDFDSIKWQRIGPRAIADVYGWRLSFKLKRNHHYYPTYNPLNVISSL